MIELVSTIHDHDTMMMWSTYRIIGLKIEFVKYSKKNFLASLQLCFATMTQQKQISFDSCWSSGGWLSSVSCGAEANEAITYYSRAG
jgi:hypothetical protein